MSEARVQVEAIIEALWQPLDPRAPSEVYAILDAARDPGILPFVVGKGVRHECLYEGPVPRELLDVAPYLVPLQRESPFTRELLERAWGQSWGLFLMTSEDVPTVRRHLRRFLKVKDEQGRRLYFRYYDPRVMRVYLPTCNEDEREFIFGPLQAWSMEGPGGTALLRYSLGEHAEMREQTEQLAGR
ncbi:DUF4123 domain-containing protein [Corallococcus sp. M34]|uniref:DUF4123 domain-containing protein n=1 Tax=Citreicoccus inhibens TaxID=2849499 RepID=UPI0013156CC0|nr:DUF4123 domain-containing protein [Citreicoccus inhibens]MBU8898347.1 DUF4123 domain-containing protein [Citreicoccus inhibens]